MGYRNIMISNPVKLSIKNEQLILDGEIQRSIPLEDINCILIENQQTTLTTYFLQQASDSGIVLYICNKKHIPNTVILPMSRHSRHFKMLKNQIAINKPLQKRLWQQIVIQKILNQAKCLELNEIEGYEDLYSMSRQVQSGDKTNIEAKAAAYYFKKLFGDYFVRRDDSVVNIMLNYGYAIIRGIVARSIVCYGFEPSIGLFHSSELNSFNLADDFIEPFRPIVDLYVSQKFDYAEVNTGMTVDMKQGLFSLLGCDMEVCGEMHSLSNSIDKLIMSYSSCLLEKRQELMLPQLVSLQNHQYE